MAIDRRKKAGDRTDAQEGGPGHVALDDRGNRTWEWTEDEELQADDELGATARLNALVDRRLHVADEEEMPDDPKRVNPKGLKSGYNPYNSGLLGKQSWKKKKDLRELSKWIQVRKRVAAKRDED